MAQGICKAIYPCTRDGDVANPPISPTAALAVGIRFEMDTGIATPPQNQLDLKRDMERMLHALLRQFPEGKPDAKFRPYYVQLLTLAQLGLAGPSAMPEIAKHALEGMTAELIDNEGPAVKNGHMMRLSALALWYSLPCILIYLVLRLTRGFDGILKIFGKLAIDPLTLSCFMLLWIGCFLGVVLSYGARTTSMSLDDLINVDADRLVPQVRLLFAGALTMVFGIFLFLGIVELKVGPISSIDIGSNPMLAFLIGALCGITELALPGVVTKKAGDLLGLK